MPMRFRTMSSPTVPAPDATPVPPQVQEEGGAANPYGRRPSLPFLTVDPAYNEFARQRSSLTSASATDLRTPQTPYSAGTGRQSNTRRSSRQSRASTFAPPWASTLDFTSGYNSSRPVPEPEYEEDMDMDTEAPVFTNPWGVDGDLALQPERPHKSDPIRYHLAAAMMSVRMSVFRVKRRWRERRGSA